MKNKPVIPWGIVVAALVGGALGAGFTYVVVAHLVKL